MKKMLYFFICSAIVLACTQTEKKEVTRDRVKDTASYALSLDSVKLYMAYYDTIAHRNLHQDAPVRAFTVRAADLLEVLGLPKTSDVQYQFVRVYLGLDFNNHFRVFLTPVEGADIYAGKAGKDVTLRGPHTHGLASAPRVQIDSGAYMLDFSSPCPNTCPE